MMMNRTDCQLLFPNEIPGPAANARLISFWLCSLEEDGGTSVNSHLEPEIRANPFSFSTAVKVLLCLGCVLPLVKYLQYAR